MKFVEDTHLDFDEVINRVGTHSDKWDNMERFYGVSPKDGIAMWVADMDFRPPSCAADAIKRMHEHGVYGYFGDGADYMSAIIWWMKERHNWDIEQSWIFTAHGLVNGTAMVVDTFTEPGDGIILFSPVYHAFSRVINAADRKVVECPLKIADDRYTMDFDAYEEILTGNEKMIILCSPHNPGGTVWTKDELQNLANFAKKHDLLIVSDEIHHDLVMPGQMHVPMPLADPSIIDRLIMMTAPTKTFNIAGCHTGQIIIQDEKLRAQYAKRTKAMGISGNTFGLMMTEAVYSTEGSYWVNSLMSYLDENARIFDEGINRIPDLHSMGLQATYLAWVDFSEFGMRMPEVVDKLQKEAKIAASHGSTFGTGGENFMRFNIGLPRSRLVEAVKRMQDAFG